MKEKVKVHSIGIIMNGVTGRMGTNQHLLRSIVPIIEQGGVVASNGDVIVPDPVLVGRNTAKLADLAERSGVEKFTTDLDQVLEDPRYTLYFDAQTTAHRAAAVRKAVAAGKDVYVEKPTALTTNEAYELYRFARDAGIKHGVVQDKLWLPGFLKLKGLIDGGFFGEILSIKGDFGYWVFEGDLVLAQRPSWNYRKEDGGGIILDMFPHWNYILENLFGLVASIICLGATHIKQRWDEQGQPYACTADDAAYALFQLDSGVIAQFNQSWATRVRRDDLVTIQVDGTRGSAVAGLRQCHTQSYDATPKPVWNPDVDQPIDFRADWRPVPDHGPYVNPFKIQWETFLRHIVEDAPFPYDFLAGARGVQLAEVALSSWRHRQWEDIPELEP